MTESHNEILERPSTWTRLLHFRRGPWENLATVLIGLGVVMLM